MDRAPSCAGVLFVNYAVGAAFLMFFRVNMCIHDGKQHPLSVIDVESENYAFDTGCCSQYVRRNILSLCMIELGMRQSAA